MPEFLTWAFAISTVTAIGTATFMWLLGGGHKSGWYVSLANQFVWIALALVTGAYGLLPMNIFLTCNAIRALRRWGKGKLTEDAQWETAARQWYADRMELRGAVANLLIIETAPLSTLPAWQTTPEWHDKVIEMATDILIRTDDEAQRQAEPSN